MKRFNLVALVGFAQLFMGFGSLEARFICNMPHEQYMPEKLPYEKVMGVDTKSIDQIVNKLNNFGFAAYKLYSVNDSLFLLDNINDIIKNRLRKGVPWENYINRLIEQYAIPGTVALDVGAHIGTNTITLSKAVGPKGKVIAFEPQPKLFCELFMNMQINHAENIQFYWGALGDKAQSVNLPNFRPGYEVAYLFDNSYGKSGNVAQMVTLDSLNLSNVSFIKVDIDGCEEIFLQGAKETIKRNKPVMVIEIYGGVDIKTATPEQKAVIIRVQNLIKAMGYTVKQIRSHNYLALPN